MRNNTITFNKDTQINLAWLVGVTVVISLVLVFISLAIFLNSGAYTTVKQISAAKNALQGNLGDIDVKSPLQAQELELYSNTLPQRVRTLDSQEDFGPIVW